MGNNARRQEMTFAISARETAGESPLWSGPLDRMVRRYASLHGLLEAESVEHLKT